MLDDYCQFLCRELSAHVAGTARPPHPVNDYAMTETVTWPRKTRELCNRIIGFGGSRHPRSMSPVNDYKTFIREKGEPVLKERPTRSDAELRQEFAKMQRAQFIIWLVEHDDAALVEFDQVIEMGDDGALDWASVREELNQHH